MPWCCSVNRTDRETEVGEIPQSQKPVALLTEAEQLGEPKGAGRRPRSRAGPSRMGWKAGSERFGRVRRARRASRGVRAAAGRASAGEFGLLPAALSVMKWLVWGASDTRGLRSLRPPKLSRSLPRTAKWFTPVYRPHPKRTTPRTQPIPESEEERRWQRPAVSVCSPAGGAK
jgi:hypothetical protein